MSDGLESGISSAAMASCVENAHTSQSHPAWDGRCDNSSEKTIVVVDDDDMCRELLHNFLSLSRYLVISAASASHAMELIHDNDYKIDLLISDVEMPGQSGVDLYHYLSTVIPSLRVIFISGYPKESLKHIDIEFFYDNFLPKPFRLSELLIRIQDALQE